MRNLSRLASGVLVHAAITLVLVCFVRPIDSAPATPKTQARLVWTSQINAGLSGGSSGDRLKAAPAAPAPRAEPVQRLLLPAAPEVHSALELPGIVAVLTAADANGPGTDLGTGKGPGDGPGPGTGPGNRQGPGAGDGPFDDGAPGVTSPRLIAERRPEYTAGAMQAKVQGDVLLDATVLADGTVGIVRVVRSVDTQFGLDQKAIDAVRAWKFRPGTYLGKPVPVKVLIELAFRLR